jgi:hypothetical protein
MGGSADSFAPSRIGPVTGVRSVLSDFSVGASPHCVGRIIERQRLTRRQFERLLNGVAVDTEIIMESCGTAHYWGRRAQARG